MRPCVQEGEEGSVKGRPKTSQSWQHGLEAAGKNGVRVCAELEAKGNGSCPPYPGSRKARFSRTARVTIGSLGTSKATGPSLSRGSLHQRRQGVSKMPCNQEYSEYSILPSPLTLGPARPS